MHLETKIGVASGDYVSTSPDYVTPGPGGVTTEMPVATLQIPAISHRAGGAMPDRVDRDAGGGSKDIIHD